MKKRIAFIAVMFLAGAGGALLYLAAAQTPSANEQPIQLPEPYGFDLPHFVHAQQIVIEYQTPQTPSASRSREQAAELAVALRKKITAGEVTFEEAARSYSNAPSASAGGDLGFVTKDNVADMPGSLDLFLLKPGRVSMVIEGESGFCLYRSLPFERKYFRTINIRYKGIEEQRPQHKARALADEIYAKITSGELTFAAAADQYSEIKTAPGGYIGEVVPGQYTPAFDEAIHKLEPGEMTPVTDDRTCYFIAKRCPPEHYTFSYSVFPIQQTGSDLEEQKKAAEAFIAAANDSSTFYTLAQKHLQQIGWDAPWYRISKDLFEHKLAPEVYAFLQHSTTGEISKPIVANNAIYVLLKEELIELE